MTQPNVYWTLRAPFATIIGLYTNVPSGGYFDREQVKWLVSELADAPADDALIIALHHEPYGATPNMSGSGRVAKTLDGAFADAGRVPDLVLSAQAHNYQRFSRVLDGRSVSYVVAGAGGYYNLHKMGPGVTVPLQVGDVKLEHFCDDRHGFLRVTAAPGSLRCDYVAINSRDKLSEPTVLDSFTIAVGSKAADRLVVTSL
jgi:3',5'-cyclic AMP phosphodiesterase CpdA